MPFRIRRSRRHARGNGPLDLDQLSRSGLRGPEPVTPIDRPDTVRPRRHQAPLTLSSAADWELEVVQWIDELHARGALDDGTHYVADEMIRTRLAAELELVDDEARSATTLERGLLVGNDQAAVRRAQHEVTLLRERDAQLRAQIEEHAAQLQGRAPAGVVVLEPAAVRPLPAAPDLNALLPPPVRHTTST
ncbi:hypothetical protein [uncultured Pseudonocardia sp.]|uniref:hypothetical protein n=1 Tax=uncultured Pseudonocardia sp. TaxID=211455 RepID=UPI00260C00BE|nr:hypothetical protein [uncultured Pseudonocardia sp.]